jgi:glyoxylase-like metal-dependent hydrolase (beta-lactamase superfamily II)
MIKIAHIGEVTRIRLARTLFGRGIYFTCAYLVDGLMIDTGCRHTVPELTDCARDLHVEQIVNTHSHEDHIAGNAALQSRFGAPVSAHPAALPILERPQRIQLHPYQKIMWGRPEPSHGQPIGETVETEEHRFEVIHTPGHSPDHICLFEPDKGLLFTGDAFIGGQDKALRADYDIWQITASLKKLLALSPGTMFTGSGTVKENSADELQRKIDYLEETGMRVRALREKGLTYRRIQRELFGSEMPIAYYTLGHFSGKHLVRSFVEDFPST